MDLISEVYKQHLNDSFYDSCPQSDKIIFPLRLSTVYRGPFVTIKEVMASFTTIPFLGGMGDFFSCGAEGVAQVVFHSSSK